MIPAISQLFEDLITRHGDTPRGVGWENSGQEYKRSKALFDIFKHESNPSILDFGCWPARFLDFLKTQDFQCDYIGIDANLKSIELAKAKYPKVLFLHSESPVPAQYVIANGVFTPRMNTPEDIMWAYTTSLLTELWGACQKAVIFNFHTPLIRWPALAFSPPFEKIIPFVGSLTRKFSIKHDYLPSDYFIVMNK